MKRFSLWGLKDLLQEAYQFPTAQVTCEEKSAVSQPSWVSPVAPSPLSMSPASQSYTSANCHFDGQTQKTRWKKPITFTVSTFKNHEASGPSRSRPCLSPVPESRPETSVLSSCCGCALPLGPQGLIQSPDSTPQGPVTLTLSIITAQALLLGCGTMLTTLTGLGCSPGFLQIMNLYQLNQDSFMHWNTCYPICDLF